jgi:excisionase family DNA binding protein
MRGLLHRQRRHTARAPSAVLRCPNNFFLPAGALRHSRDSTRYRVCQGARGISMRTLELSKLPPTISVEEAAVLLGISRSAAYRAAKAGQLVTFRVGRRLLVPTAPLLRILGR